MAEIVRFQHYEVLRREDGSLCELGRGAMGITYKAFDTNLRCNVALKVINHHYLNSEVARQRFLREARAAAAIRHPNVATVFHLGSEDDAYFYAMEFIDGETVEAFMKREGAVPTVQALDIASQVARALGAAQRQGLVHRDIKPSNIMLVRDEDGERIVKVIDFGLAKAANREDAADTASLTQGGFLGTPHFASPEQLEERELDVRSDIYSLGVTLFYMLAGKAPFSGSLAQVMSQHLYQEPPLQLLADQPPEVVALLQWLLAKDPGGRPQTPSDLRRAIEECIESVRTRSEEGTGRASGPADVESFATVALPTMASDASLPSLPEEVPAEPRRRSSFATYLGLAGAAAVLLGGLAAWTMFFRQDRTPPKPAYDTPEPTPILAEATPITTPEPTPTPTPEDPRKLAYESLIAKAREQGTNFEYDVAFKSLADARTEFTEYDAAIVAEMEKLAAKLRTETNGETLTPAELERLKHPLTAVAEAGSSSAQMLLAKAYLARGDTADAFKYFLLAANSNSEASFQVAEMYASGIGTQADLSMAIPFYQKAADAGEPQAMYALGECYLLGKGGVIKDRETALRHLGNAAGFRNPNAMYQLGHMYRTGDGVARDFTRAYELFSEAMNLGSLDAQAGVAIMLMNGEVVDGKAVTGAPDSSKGDPEKAVALFKDGAEQGNRMSMGFYGQCLFSGHGVKENKQEGRSWIAKAASLGDLNAQQLCTRFNIPYTLPTPAVPKSDRSQ
jgi:serine/threonine protein kinase/TPR repeat protein